MAIDYSTLLSNDDRRRILSQRISQFAVEGYQHTLNRDFAVKTGDAVLEEKSTTDLAIIDSAIELHQEELDKLPSDVVEPS